MRRVDPDGRTLGRFFAEEIAAPLGLEVYFGAPDDLPQRAARADRARSRRGRRSRRCATSRARWRSRWRTRARSRSGPSPTRACAARRTSTAPSTGGSSSRRAARSARRATSRAPTRRSWPTRPSSASRPRRMAELTRFPRPPAHGWHDEVLKVETAFSLGFARPLGEFRFGSNDRAFGHPGRGRLVRLRRPRPGRLVRLRDEPARLPPERRPAREAPAGRAVPLPRLNLTGRACRCAEGERQRPRARPGHARHQARAQALERGARRGPPPLVPAQRRDRGGAPVRRLRRGEVQHAGSDAVPDPGLQHRRHLRRLRARPDPQLARARRCTRSPASPASWPAARFRCRHRSGAASTGGSTRRPARSRSGSWSAPRSSRSARRRTSSAARRRRWPARSAPRRAS